ncbi:nuclease-related domain-containing protein [Bacillus sp. AK031]
MIVKERQVPEKIAALEALLERIPAHHEKREKIQNELRSRRRGFKGELAFDYYLKLLPDDDYYILNHLRLPYKSTFFQIDSLLISEKLILILEIKNLSGKLHFDHSFRQLTRTFNDIEKGYAYPLSQVQRHYFQLNQWLQLKKFPKLPIEYFVIQSDSSSILSNESKNRVVYQRVIHGGAFLEKLSELENRYRDAKMDKKMLEKLLKMLQKDHTPHTSDVLSQFNIGKEEIRTGVQCQTCSSLPLKRVNGGWFCYQCKDIHKKAHEKAIFDYFILIAPQASNSELRSFLHLPSRSVMQRILTSMELHHQGTGKARTYSKK